MLAQHYNRTLQLNHPPVAIPARLTKESKLTDVEKRLPGAPAKYGPHIVTKAAALAADGLIDAEIAIELGIHVRTLHAWKRVHPEFAEALRSAKDSVDDRVEESLIESALGGEYTEEVATASGQVVEVRKLRHGDVQAQKWWLANRRPKEYSLTPRGARKALDFGVIDGSAKSISEAGVNVLRLMAAGELSVEEGQAAATVLAAIARALETGELEQRLAELEGTSQKLLTHE